MSSETLINIGFPLCATMGFVPHPFSLLSGLHLSDKFFSSFIVEEIEADDYELEIKRNIDGKIRDIL
jgi:hypothetical protein